MMYYVSAQNLTGDAGERPLIEADSPEEAIAVYRETHGALFQVTRVDVA